MGHARRIHDRRVGGLVVHQAQRDVASDLDGLSDRLFDAGGIKAIEVLM